MRNLGSYQLVSEHSIQGNAQGDMHKIMESEAEADLEHRIDAVEQKVERMAETLEELKAMMAELRDIESKPEMKTKEVEEEGWNESIEEGLKFQQLEVMVTHQDQKKKDESEKENEEPEEIVSKAKEETASAEKEEDAGTRREGLVVAEPVKCDEVEEKNENIFPDLKYQNSSEGAKSEVTKEEEDSPDEKTPKNSSEATLTEEPPPEPPDPPNCGVFKGGSRSLVVVKREGDDEESPTTATGNGTTATKVPSVHDLESLFLVVKICDSEREEKQSGGNDQTAATTPGGGTVAEATLLGDARTQSPVLVTEHRDTFGKEKEACVRWSSKLFFR